MIKNVTSSTQDIFPSQIQFHRRGGERNPEICFLLISYKPVVDRQVIAILSHVTPAMGSWCVGLGGTVFFNAAYSSLVSSGAFYS